MAEAIPMVLSGTSKSNNSEGGGGLGRKLELGPAPDGPPCTQSLASACDTRACASPDEPKYVEQIEIARGLIKQHAETLRVKRLQKRRIDSYGVRDDSNWDKEIVYFLETVVYPKLPAFPPAEKDFRSDRDFRIPLAHNAPELRDRDARGSPRQVCPKRDRLQEKVRKAREKLDREQAQASKSKWDAAVSFGNSVHGAFLGKKTVSNANAGRASAAAKAAGKAMQKSTDVGQAEADLDAALREFTDMEITFKEEVDKIGEMFLPEMLMLNLKGIIDAELDSYESPRPTSKADIASMSPLEFESFSPACSQITDGTP